MYHNYSINDDVCRHIYITRYIDERGGGGGAGHHDDDDLRLTTDLTTDV